MLADIYVLATERSAAKALAFLERFLPDRVAVADDYPVPEYADQPEHVLNVATDLFEWCEAHTNQPYAIYWRNARNNVEPHSAHVFFLADGGMVFGLSTRRDGEGDLDALLRQLQSFAGSDIGYWALEQPPALTTQEFQRRAGIA